MVNTCLLSIPTETRNIRKPDVFWCFQRVVQKGNNDLECVNIFLKSCWHRPSNSISKYVTPDHEAKISWITIVLLNSKIPMELLLPLLFLPHREIIVCIGVSPPPTFHLKKSTPSFSPSSPLICKLSKPPFLDNSPQYIAFVDSPLKFGFFSKPA